MKKQVRLLFISFSFLTLLLAFQNCGEVKFKKGNTEIEPERIESANSGNAISLVSQTVFEGQPVLLEPIISQSASNPSFIWTKDGAVLAGQGDSSLSIAAAQLSDQGLYEVIYIDGSTELGRTQAQLTVIAEPEPEEEPAKGIIIGSKLFSSSGTYTPTEGTRNVLVMVVAAGGGGGGGGHQWAYGAPGGKGGSETSFLPVPSGSVAVTVGAAGKRGHQQNGGRTAGGAGGSSSFGSLITCSGGSGGAMTGSKGMPAPAASGACSSQGSESNADVSSMIPAGGPSNAGQGGAAGRDYWGAGGTGGAGVVYIIEFN